MIEVEKFFFYEIYLDLIKLTHFSKMTSLIKFSLRCKTFINFTECKRFAGHSKWANIKHTKMAKDAQKSAALRIYVNKMRVAIAEGKSADPETNIRLARIIEEAKKKSMPMTTIKNYLEKAQRSKMGSTTAFLESRGPSGSIVLIHLLTDNLAHTRSYLNNRLKKSGFTTSEMPSARLFTEKGLIYAEVEGRDIDKITDDAIEAGAEEAEKLQEDGKEFIQFTCGASEMHKVRQKLEELSYKIIEAEVLYIPERYVTLSDNEMEIVGKLYDRLNEMEEVVHVYNNIST